MRRVLKTLDASYRSRAIPVGSPRYWSWLFASAETRAPLLGIYALLAEWNALTDPASERDAALIKLEWWRDEIRRWVNGSPVHPIGIYIASLPRASQVDFAPLISSIDAAAADANGAPLEHATDLQPHVHSLRAVPLGMASRLAGAVDEASLDTCTRALAVADYISRSIREYRREARSGRVPFPIDELLAAGVDNQDLTAAEPPSPLASYLKTLRDRAASYYEAAAQALAPGSRAEQRHLLVLAALGLAHLPSMAAARKPRAVRDMLLAWSTARRAHG
jgi:15-cis-phytoene synthase